MSTIFLKHRFSTVIAEGPISLAEKSMNLPQTGTVLLFQQCSSVDIQLSAYARLVDIELQNKRLMTNSEKEHFAIRVSYKNQW